MNDEIILIKDLKKIVDDDYNLVEKKIINYTAIMLKYIGSPNSFLRDDLIYSIFYYWIMEKDYFTNDNLIWITKTLIDKDHLWYKIGSDNDDSVFTRSFSMLTISLLLFRNVKGEFLCKDIFDEVKNKIILYCYKEIDLRGYDNEKGWIHSAAHTADALCNLILNNECDRSTVLEVLESIKQLLNNKKYIFANEEDERIARVILELVENHKVSNEMLINWFNELVSVQDQVQGREKYHSRVNIKNFIRSLYFSILYINGNNIITSKLIEVENRLNRYICH